MTAYSDYCNAEKAAGRKPLPPKDWSQARKSTPPVAEAEGMSAPNPFPNDSDPEDSLPQEDAQVIADLQARLESEDPLAKAARLRAEAAQLEAQALGATPEDQREIQEKKSAEKGEWIFKSEYRMHEITLWSSNPYKEGGHHYAGEHVAAKFSYGVYRTTDPKKAEMLLATEDYRKGIIYLVPEAIQNAVVGISDGPRTSIAGNPRVARPAGALSAPLD